MATITINLVRSGGKGAKERKQDLASTKKAQSLGDRRMLSEGKK